VGYDFLRPAILHSGIDYMEGEITDDKENFKK
jgi:hypothetical protein